MVKKLSSTLHEEPSVLPQSTPSGKGLSYKARKAPKNWLLGAVGNDSAS